MQLQPDGAVPEQGWSCKEPGMQRVPSLCCGAGVRAAEGQGAPSVQTARRGTGWEADGVALLGHGTAVGPKQVQVGENGSAFALGGLWMRASLSPR